MPDDRASSMMSILSTVSCLLACNTVGGGSLFPLSRRTQWHRLGIEANMQPADINSCNSWFADVCGNDSFPDRSIQEGLHERRRGSRQEKWMTRRPARATTSTCW
jgi:hypothetical protein